MDVRTGLVALLLFVLASCGGGSDAPAPPATPPATTTAPPAALSYPAAPPFVEGVAISALNPTVTGSVTAYSVSPMLPAGLSLNTTSGAITGTATIQAPQAGYTVTANNAGGSTATAVTIAVNARPPAISYGAGRVTLTVAMPSQAVVPTNTGGAATSWTITPSLSGGLSFNTGTGVISGTPAAIFAPATYTVVAQNSGGMSTATVTLGAQAVLLDLGHSKSIDLLRVSGNRVLSVDNSLTWVLWDRASATRVVGAVSACWSLTCQTNTLTPGDLKGSTVVVETAAGLQIRNAATGSVLGVISTPVIWWNLAEDGSYVCGGSSTALTVWSRSGAVVATRAGDYVNAKVFAAAAGVQIARGPAGADVIETVSLPSGSSTTSPQFQGLFKTWFQDGQRFLTNTANTVQVYSNQAVQVDIRALTTVENLTGQGDWFWTYTSTGHLLSLYKVGASGAPIATYTFSTLTKAIASGPTIGVMDYGTGTGAVIDLSGTTPVSTPFNTPLDYQSTYAASSGTQWLLATRFGVLLDGASLGGTLRYFGYGEARSIAGGNGAIAVATARGEIVYFDATTLARSGSLPFASSLVQLSTDGSVLAAAGDREAAQYQDDWSVRIYSLPSGALSFTWPYSFANRGPSANLPFDMTLSDSGALLAQTLGASHSSWDCTRQVTPATGGAALWTDGTTLALGVGDCEELPVRLSPNGTKVAISGYLTSTVGTNIYDNGALVAAVSGRVVDWLDDNRILVDNYTRRDVSTVYTGSSIHDSAGTKLGSLQLPEMQLVQRVTADSIYVPATNAIYSTTTGAALWSSDSVNTGVGAVAGDNVVFSSAGQVFVQPIGDH